MPAVRSVTDPRRLTKAVLSRYVSESKTQLSWRTDHKSEPVGTFPLCLEWVLWHASGGLWYFINFSCLSNLSLKLLLGHKTNKQQDPRLKSQLGAFLNGVYMFSLVGFLWVLTVPKYACWVIGYLKLTPERVRSWLSMLPCHRRTTYQGSAPPLTQCPLKSKIRLAPNSSFVKTNMKCSEVQHTSETSGGNKTANSSLLPFAKGQLSKWSQGFTITQERFKTVTL